MNTKMKLFCALAALLFSAGTLFAQEDEAGSPLSVGADLVSRYVWRGINLGGPTPAVQPYAELAFGSETHALAVGTWGSYSFNGFFNVQEADLYLSYTYNDMFSLAFTDYFFPDDMAASHDYFNYNMDWNTINDGTKEQTGHVFETALSFNGTDDIPFSLMFAVNVWGADSRKYSEESGVMLAQDGIVMSKYLELGYSKDIKGTTLDVFAGMALDDPKEELGEPYGFYGQRSMGVINLGLTVSKEIQITDKFSLPVFGSFITNPESEKVFLVFGLSI
jgi:hypothetical protein